MIYIYIYIKFHFIIYMYNEMKLTVQLIERMNATRKLTMVMGWLGRLKFKITKKSMLWKTSCNL